MYCADLAHCPDVSCPFSCHFASKAVANAGIDDAVDAIAVHLGSGSTGVVMAAFFHSDLGIFYNWVSTGR